MNLWTALECLGSLSGKDSVIGKICALVCPIVTWRKFEKIARYCAINIHRWRVVSGSKLTTTRIFPGENPKRVSTSDVIKILCLPDKHADLVELAQITHGHPLLAFRLGEINEKFRDPIKFSSSLTDSRNHLEWHLSRIYRARNLLVHSGREVPQLETLCDHLDYYVVTVLSRVLHGLSENRRWGPVDSARHWMLVGDFVIQKLKDNPTELALENLMPKVSAQSDCPWKDWSPTKKQSVANAAPAPAPAPAALPLAARVDLRTYRLTLEGFSPDLAQNAASGTGWLHSEGDAFKS